MREHPSARSFWRSVSIALVAAGLGAIVVSRAASAQSPTATPHPDWAWAYGYRDFPYGAPPPDGDQQQVTGPYTLGTHMSVQFRHVALQPNSYRRHQVIIALNARWSDGSKRVIKGGFWNKKGTSWHTTASQPVVI